MKNCVPEKKKYTQLFIPETYLNVIGICDLFFSHVGGQYCVSLSRANIFGICYLPFGNIAWSLEFGSICELLGNSLWKVDDIYGKKVEALHDIHKVLPQSSKI